MPTATSIEGEPIFNLGPLTSTWSAPSSCYTNGFNTALAYNILPEEGILLNSILGCAFNVWDEMDDCFPDGGDFMSTITSLSNKPEPTYGGHYFHSPGRECPEGWYTAGAATMNSESDVEKTGIMFETYVTKSIGDVYFKPYGQRFADGLDAGETGIWCCPSGYEVDRPGEGCYSTLEASDFTVTEICREGMLNSLRNSEQTFTIDGTAVTRSNYYTWEGERTMTTEIEKTTLGPDYLEDETLTPVVFYPMITMVHKEGDEDADEGSEGGSNEGNSEGGSGDGDNAATGLMHAGVMAAVIGAAGVLGAALVL